MRGSLTWLCLLLLTPLAVAHGDAATEPLPNGQFVHRLPDIQASFEEWNTAWPERVDLQTLGETPLGFPVENIRITDEAVAYDNASTATGKKIRVYLDGGHHGNEYLGTEIIMYYLQQVLEEWDDGFWADYFATHELWATPLINVEGNSFDTRKNSNQVDPNRNYPFRWAEDGPGLVADFNYPGPEALSEPEVRANAEFGAELRPDLWVTMHSGISMWLWPWGNQYDRAPDADLFEGMEAEFENRTNGVIDAKQSADLYPAFGATDDYGYGQVGVPTFTYEVGDDQFFPVYGEPIVDSIQWQIDGLDWVVREARFIGAWIEVHTRDGEFHVFNAGWGNATNVTVTWTGGEQVIPLIPAGEMYVFDAIPGNNITVEYTPLQIETSQPRTVAYTGDAMAPVDEAEPSAAPGLLILAAAALGLARRRR